MSCSPDLSGYLYDCYFEILIRLNNVSPSISLSFVYEALFFLVFGTYDFISSFSLILCVGFCALAKTVLRVVSCKRYTLWVSLT